MLSQLHRRTFPAGQDSFFTELSGLLNHWHQGVNFGDKIYGILFQARPDQWKMAPPHLLWKPPSLLLCLHLRCLLLSLFPQSLCYTSSPRLGPHYDVKRSPCQLPATPSHSAEVKKFQRSFLTGVFSETKVNSVDYRLLTATDSVSGDKVSASFTFGLLTLFLPCFWFLRLSQFLRFHVFPAQERERKGWRSSPRLQ